MLDINKRFLSELNFYEHRQVKIVGRGILDAPQAQNLRKTKLAACPGGHALHNNFSAIYSVLITPLYFNAVHVWILTNL